MGSMSQESGIVISNVSAAVLRVADSVIDEQ